MESLWVFLYIWQLSTLSTSLPNLNCSPSETCPVAAFEVCTEVIFVCDTFAMPKNFSDANKAWIFALKNEIVLMNDILHYTGREKVTEVGGCCGMWVTT